MAESQSCEQPLKCWTCMDSALLYLYCFWENSEYIPQTVSLGFSGFYLVFFFSSKLLKTTKPQHWIIHSRCSCWFSCFEPLSEPCNWRQPSSHKGARYPQSPLLTASCWELPMCCCQQGISVSRTCHPGSASTLRHRLLWLLETSKEQFFFCLRRLWLWEWGKRLTIVIPLVSVDGGFFPVSLKQGSVRNAPLKWPLFLKRQIEKLRYNCFPVGISGRVWGN